LWCFFKTTQRHIDYVWLLAIAEHLTQGVSPGSSPLQCISNSQLSISLDTRRALVAGEGDLTPSFRVPQTVSSVLSHWTLFKVLRLLNASGLEAVWFVKHWYPEGNNANPKHVIAPRVLDDAIDILVHWLQS
jgi:hypothetical protein